MAFNEKSLDDYIDVPERIAEFREKYPEGSLQPANPKKPFRLETITVTLTMEDGSHIQAPKTFIVYGAAAYRTPDDQRPGIGFAWETVPGLTPYTRNSELMNAETSAWGRAIVATLAADSKRGIATRSEVAARRAEREEPLAQAPRNGVGPGPSPAGTPGPTSPEGQALADTAKRVRSLDSLRNVHQQATQKRLLGAPVAHPRSGEIVPLSVYLLERKAEFEQEPAQESA